jgi:hypothetical protein
VRRGTKGITAHQDGARLLYVRVTVSSVNSNCIEAEDGPVVRVGNGEYTWRVDGDKYLYPLKP